LLPFLLDADVWGEVSVAHVASLCDEQRAIAKKPQAVGGDAFR
jgi:hypothetical protein